MPAAITVAVLVILLILGFVNDLRFAILAFMLLFTVIPFMTAIMYFLFGLKPATALNGLPHNISLTSKGLNVTVFPRQLADEEEEPEPVVRTFTLSSTTKYSSDSYGITIWPAGHKSGFLTIPYHVFDDTDQFSQWMNSLRLYLDKK